MGDDFAQKFEPLAGKIGRLERESSDVAARSCQICYEAAADRAACQCKYDGDDRCRPLYDGDRGSVGENGVDFQADKLGCDLGIALGTIRPAILDRDGAPLRPAERAQSLHKSSKPWTEYRRSVREQEPDGRQFCRPTDRQGYRTWRAGPLGCHPGRRSGLGPLRVNLDRVGRRRSPVHFRCSPKTGRKFKDFGSDAVCHKHSVSQSSENLILGW